jgi:hypothetical protein
MEKANRYIREKYMPAFNEEFKPPAPEEGSAFVSYPGGDIDEVLCKHHERVAGKDNCVSFEGLKLQIPEDCGRLHYVKVSVRVHRYPDRRLAIFHGPRLLARYEVDGRLIEPKQAPKRNGQGGRTEGKRRRATPSASSPPTPA